MARGGRRGRRWHRALGLAYRKETLSLFGLQRTSDCFELFQGRSQAGIRVSRRCRDRLERRASYPTEKITREKALERLKERTNERRGLSPPGQARRLVRLH